MTGDSAITVCRWGGDVLSVMSRMAAAPPASRPPSSNTWLVRIATSRSNPLPISRQRVCGAVGHAFSNPNSASHPGLLTTERNISWQ